MILDGTWTCHNRESARSDGGVAYSDHGVFRVELFIDQFIGFGDIDDLVNALGNLDVGVMKSCLIAYYTDDGDLIPLG